MRDRLPPTAFCLVVMAACGGGDGASNSGPGPAPTPDPATLIGQFAQLGTGLPDLPGSTRRVLPIDLDRDGDLDLVAVSGFAAVWLRNDGSGTFAVADADLLPGTVTEDLAFGDLDGDGDVDAVAAAGTVRVWTNDGSGRFTDRTATALPGTTSGTTIVALADLDGDLDLDLFAGKQSARPRCYRNDGNGTFADATLAFLPDQIRTVSAVVLRDLDRDGDTDAFLDGNVLWRNDGNLRLVDATAGNVPPGAFARALAVDVDGDRDLDLLQTANWFSAAPNQLLRNDGGGRFTDVTATALPPASGREVACLAAGDVDGDGDQDVLIGSQELLLRNDGTGRFERASGDLPVVHECITDCALADLDGDSDLDAVYAATTIVLEPCGEAPRDHLLLNTGAGRFIALSAPSAPFPLLAAAATDLDGDGAPELLTGDGNVHANDGTGTFRRTQTLTGPGQTPTSPVLADVDADGDLDAFVLGRLQLQGPDGTFGAGGLEVGDATAARFLDVDGDGDPDLVVGTGQHGPPMVGGQTRLFGNDGRGRFTETTASAMPRDDAVTSAIAVADADRDGDLDLALTSRGPAEADRARRLYRNDGRGRFTDDSARLPADRGGDGQVVFVDADGDGDPDLWFDAGTRCLWRNDGAGTFAAADERAPWCGAASWLDLDEDGDADLLRRSFTTATAWFHDGHGGYTADAGFELPSAHDIPFAPVPLPVDIDADGDVDLLFENQGVLLHNLTRHLHAVMPPRPGRPFQLLVSSRPGVLRRAQTAVVWTSLAARTVPLALPPHGRFLLGDLGLSVLGTVPVPAPGGGASLTTPVPAQPALVGLTLHAQAALFDPAFPARFTNRLALVIRP